MNISIIRPSIKATLLYGVLFFLSAATFGQPIAESQTIQLTFNKTSSLVFPAVIAAVDRGSRDILAQKVKGVENVLQLKAGRMQFEETNLTVITSDGKLHHFFVSYSESPAEFAIQIGAKNKQTDSNAPIVFSIDMTDVTMKECADRILSAPRKFKITSTAKFDMKLALKGIYIQDNVMFYHIRVTNNSNIPFHTDALRFYIKDKQKAKRTASQEITEKPLFQHGDPELIKGRSTQDLVFALPKFNIPDAKVLVIQMMERKGGRHLHLKIKNKTIVKAKVVPEG